MEPILAMNTVAEHKIHWCMTACNAVMNLNVFSCMQHKVQCCPALNVVQFFDSIQLCAEQFRA